MEKKQNELLSVEERARLERNAYQREYRKKNRKKLREYQKKWREANREKVAAANQRYWLKKADERQTE